MAWRFSPYLLPTFAAGVVTLALAVYAWRRRENRAAVPFAVFLMGLSVWSFGYGIELGYTALEPMLFWDRVAWIGSVVAPTAWLLLAVEYAGYEEWLTRRRVGLLAVEPAVVLLLVWTNGSHGLIWQSASLDATGPITTPELVFGPAYWANVAYSYLLFLVGTALFVGVIVRASRLYRRQSVLILLGATVAIGVNTLFHVVPGLNPITNLDLTPFAFAVSGVCFALALFRFRMLGLSPVARETLIEDMTDGILVLDAADRIVDANPAARRALGEDVEGRPVADTVIGRSDDIDRDVVSLDGDGRSTTYEVSETPLTDFRDELVGRLVLLRDVTTLQILRDHEQRLSVVNRVLRHNIRNELTVVAGHSELLLGELDGDRREHVETIDRAADRILQISEKARHVQRTIGSERTGDEVVNVAAIVRETADSLGETHPEASVHVDAPDAAWATAVGYDQLSVAVESVGENAITHNPAADASVRLTVEPRAETVRITVADDGPGIPAAEVAVIERERETSLEHGSGLGLWLVQWVVEASDGELSVDTDGGDGSVIAIDLPRADPPDGDRDR
ncbi:histidine kinase N-terminal 7TM domain-containing protein [Halorarum halobium]|uniref:histidine kinase N-terminal 7TM domain-containing protein n=1 Tax=Halorarum halobium TaxID=3075121 RepID=UPI0028AC409F|nr:histidine kinase N-terminal 7TM domain-containing protein [Halobaculum sp. XH14]